MTIMVDTLNKVGPDVMVQVNLGMRWDGSRFLGNPEYESHAMLRAVDLRLGRGPSGRPPPEEAHPSVHGMPAMVDSYTRPVSSFEGVRFRKDTAEIAERPPMTRVLQDPTRATRSDCRDD